MLETQLTILLFSLWGAFLWRIRGGAWETFLGFVPKTQLCRFVTSLALAIPIALLFWNPWLLAITATIFLGLISVAWGPFMVIEEGLPPKETIRRIVGMSLCGFVVTSYTYALIGFLYSWIFSIPILIAGILFGPIYWLTYRSWFPKFEIKNLLWNDGHSWGEFYVGFVISFAILTSIFLCKI